MGGVEVEGVWVALEVDGVGVSTEVRLSPYLPS
jgi:hypothetical protein